MKTHRMFPRLVRCAAALLLAFAAFESSGQDRVVLDGSTGMIPLARAVGAAYQRQFADARIEIGQGLGTSARLRALIDGKIQVALASHGLAAEELRKNNLRAVNVARGAIVFAVNSSVPIAELTQAQVCDLFSGRVSNWKALNGPDLPVAVLTRPPTEVDPEVIRATIACFKNLKEVETARVMARGGDMARGLAETPHAIGMTSMTVVEQSGGKLRAMALDGIAPSADNVKAGRYVLTRDFIFVTKADPEPSVQRFLDFTLSPAGDRVIMDSGAIPLR